MSTRTGLRARRRATAAAALVLAGVLSSVLSACSTDTFKGTDPGATDVPGLVMDPTPLPDVELPGINGAATQNLADVTGPTLISVWATWCTPCRKEMPVLGEFAQTHGGVVDVLGINYQDRADGRAENFMHEVGATYPSLQDTDGKIDALAPFPRMKALPFLAVVDAEGRMVGAEFSVITEVSQLETFVEKNLPGVLGATAPVEETE
ncbi:TlpA family protein disulfide reductase [Nocardioides yefusunii]|uniref:TlpA family protein disulfide reductase n=1 Tax=Nocardioides yefusunii TaxID=2500546 RepID=A0ABW1QZT0_9ACTN|nr:TlpA disulfide reductase family protein [Nocardioides yefusunii]